MNFFEKHIFTSFKQTGDIGSCRIDPAHHMNHHLNVRIGDNSLDIIRNRDTAEVDISLLRKISHDDSTQPNRPAGPLSEQVAGRLHNPYNSTSDSAAADKCDIQFRVARHNESF